MTATHTTVASLRRRVGNIGRKLYMENIFSSPDLLDDLDCRKINCCDTVRLNLKGMPQEFRKTMKLKRGDTRTKVRDNMAAMIWKDRRHVNVLTNMHYPSREGNFRGEHGNALKPSIMQEDNQHMCYMDKSDRMINVLD